MSKSGVVVETDNAAKCEAIAALENGDAAPTLEKADEAQSAMCLAIRTSHWAQRIDTVPYRAFPVTGDITFIRGGPPPVEADVNDEVATNALRRSGKLGGACFLA